jgi:pimeloyl-ACP methyl ester carboxylesterase
MRDEAMSRANVNGVELEYEISGDGEPVLLISPVLADGFLPLLSEPSLAGPYRLITYHKRGWVGSTRTAGPVSIADHAADAAALLDHLGVRRAHVAGHSSGAAVAVQLALDHPARVHTLTLLELSLFSLPGAAVLFEKAGPALEAYGSGEHERALALFMSAVSGLDWETCRAALERAAPGSVRQSVADADTFFGVELPALMAWSFVAEQAAIIRQPVLSILGSDTEPLWVEVAEALRSWLPDVEECTIEGAGHLLHVQRPSPVANGMASFFQRHPLRQGSSALRSSVGVAAAG